MIGCLSGPGFSKARHRSQRWLSALPRDCTRHTSAGLSWLPPHEEASSRNPCGITRVTLRAGLSHGGYVWAVHGFLPETDAKWLQLAARLQAKLAALAPPLPPLQAQAISQILSSPDRFALRAVVAALTPVAATTLGKHLLLGEGWDGELDFSDQSSALIYLRRIGLLP